MAGIHHAAERYHELIRGCCVALCDQLETIRYGARWKGHHRAHPGHRAGEVILRPPQQLAGAVVVGGPGRRLSVGGW